MSVAADLEARPLLSLVASTQYREPVPDHLLQTSKVELL